MLIDEFNTMSAYFADINQSMAELAATTSNLESLSVASEPNAIYFKDSFATNQYISNNTTNQCDIVYGMATLKRSGTVQHKLSIVSIEGNGEAGNARVVHNGEYIQSNDNANNIIDNKPNTWFEYQSLDNIEFLRMKLILELEPAIINMISILPFYPAKSLNSTTIKSIRLSNDGINYTSITNSIELTSDTTTQIPITFDMPSNYKGSGIWLFKPMETKYVEIVIDQMLPYKETLGRTVYKKINTDNELVIDEHEVPENIRKAPAGRYAVNGYYIDKSIEVYEGNRYAIGLRDICIYSATYEMASEITSTTFAVDKPIQSLTMHVNEYVPNELADTLSMRNEWIKYYVSFDDINWIRISPMTHMPLNGEQLPPKIIAINSKDKMLNIYNYTTSRNVQTFRVKITIQRPEDMDMITPALLDYSVRVVCQ